MHEKLVKARTKLVLSHPFFGCLLLNCKVYETDQIATAATDGKNIMYNKNFIDTLTTEEIMGLLVHEVCHKMFLHVHRLNDREHRIWNIATDFAINLIIKEAGMILPAGALLDSRFDGQSADEIYNFIYQEVQKQMSKSGQGKGTQDPNNATDGQVANGSGIDEKDLPDHLDGKGQPQDDASRHEQEAEIKAQIAQAATLAKQAGKLPSSLQKLVGQIMKPKVDWRKQLRDFLQQTAKTDYTFKRPNRRTLVHDMYLPSLTGEEMPPIVIAFDTSGSIYGAKDTVETFVSEINGIIEDCIPEQVNVLYADTRVVHEQRLSKHETLVPELQGGGGTAFSETFKYIDELDVTPAAVLYFTDLYVSDFGQTDLPVMWCVYDNKDPDPAPFGTTIVLED